MQNNSISGVSFTAIKERIWGNWGQHHGRTIFAVEGLQSQRDPTFVLMLCCYHYKILIFEEVSLFSFLSTAYYVDVLMYENKFKGVDRHKNL
jgi:hypothetical protein